MTVELTVGFEVTDGLSCLDGLIKAMNRLGANTRHMSLAASRISPGCADGLSVVRVGEVDGKMHAVVLPSPALLRYFADEIEKKLP